MEHIRSAVVAANHYADAALEALHSRLAGSNLDAEQNAAHGYAWIATAVAALEALAAWHEELEAPSEVDRLIVTIGFGETLAQMVGGLAMGQNEIVRPSALGLEDRANELATNPDARTLIADGNTVQNRATIPR